MNWGLFLQLMRKDWVQLKRVYPGKFLDACLLFFTNVVVFAYFFPNFSSSSDYGVFICIGAIAILGLFDIVAQVGELIFDIQGDRTINFTLSMPGSYWLILSQFAVRWGWNNLLLYAPLFVVGKLLLWEQFDLSQVSFWRLALIFPSACLFFGFFSLSLAAIFKNLKSLASLFFRFINPIFMFGGYFFSWQMSYDLSPTVAYCLLINPVIYIMEGMRAAALGQAGYLPFWVCFLALWVFIILLGTYAIKSLKKRLDCV